MLGSAQPRVRHRALTTLGAGLGMLVAWLALLAASTGLCVGCELYRVGASLRGIRDHEPLGIGAIKAPVGPVVEELRRIALILPSIWFAVLGRHASRRAPRDVCCGGARGRAEMRGGERVAPVTGARLRALLHRIGEVAGLDLMRYQSIRHPVGRRIRLMRGLSIDLVLDVGANEGQYALELRRWGYRGRIVSFEPLSSPFRALRARADRDDRWEAVCVALGERSETLQMHVAANAAASSSILPMLPLHDDVAPYARYIAVEDVEVRRLDDLMPAHRKDARSILLKADVQGYEAAVLRGAPVTLQEVAAVQLELSLIPLYEGAPLLPETVGRLADHGLKLVGIEPGLADPRNGHLLTADGIFARIKDDPSR